MANYSLIRTYDTADGIGIRTAVYFSGCQKAMEGNPCEGCHNITAWDKDAGKEWNEEIQQRVIESLKENYIAGLSILGGEPFSDFNVLSVEELVVLAKHTYPEKEIWVWSGYTIEELLQKAQQSITIKDILNHVDVLVDGPFIQQLKEPNLVFRGSKNQRILKINTTENKDIQFEDITASFVQ